MTQRRDWFACFCNQCAANVLDKNGGLRFTYEQLSAAVTAIEYDHENEVPSGVRELCDKITAYCDSKYNWPGMHTNSHLLLLTLCNIQVSFWIGSGLWKEQTDKDYCGFEIF